MIKHIKWGLALKVLRESRSLSALELSEKAGLPSYTVSRIETGKLNLDFITAIILARQLDVSLDLIASTANNLPPELLEQEIKLIETRKEIKELRTKTKNLRQQSIP